MLRKSILFGATLVLLLVLAYAAYSQTTTPDSSLTVAWLPPTTYVDGTVIPSGTAITYNLYGALKGAPKTAVLTGFVGLSSIQAVTPGNWCYAITSVVASVESSPTTEICSIMTAPSPPAPSAPGQPTVNSVTIATTVYMEVQVANGFSFLPIGTVPLGTPCDPSQRVNDFSVVPASAVTWTGKIQRQAALAACSSP